MRKTFSSRWPWLRTIACFCHRLYTPCCCSLLLSHQKAYRRSLRWGPPINSIGWRIRGASWWSRSLWVSWMIFWGMRSAAGGWVGLESSAADSFSIDYNLIFGWLTLLHMGSIWVMVIQVKVKEFSIGNLSNVGKLIEIFLKYGSLLVSKGLKGMIF